MASCPGGAVSLENKGIVRVMTVTLDDHRQDLGTRMAPSKYQIGKVDPAKCEALSQLRNERYLQPERSTMQNFLHQIWCRESARDQLFFSPLMLLLNEERLR